MGREVRRVPLDFDWSINKRWEGFVNPYYEKCKKCPHCDGSGYNPETKKISDDWYDFAQSGRRWCNKITQDEVDKLVEEGRLMDFTHRLDSEGWRPIDPPPKITAEMVNAWAGSKRLGHDAINRTVCVRQRARRLGVYGHCPACGGRGDSWETPQAKADAEAWEPTDPPTGDGWQLWETVSEGSPISPVFATAEELAQFITDGGGRPLGAPATYEQALAFVRAGWAPSMVTTTDHGVEGGVNYVGRLAETERDER